MLVVPIVKTSEKIQLTRTIECGLKACCFAQIIGFLSTALMMGLLLES
jgi:hypothetical protein|tara:strand:+ start:560 stop:703 length:144 start_codon:yes stop_codon:yes gene_type:complete